MKGYPTVKDLEARWEKTLLATRHAAAAHPVVYRQLKVQAAAILDNTVDINDYFPTVEQLIEHLKALDPAGSGSIFDIFSSRISPSSIWQVGMLRMECRDLLAHLDVFDKWRREMVCLRMVKGSAPGRKSPETS